MSRQKPIYNKTEIVRLRCTKDWREELDMLCKAYGMTRSALVRYSIDKLSTETICRQSKKKEGRQ